MQAKCNYGAQWAANEDKNMGIVRVRRGHTTIGQFHRMAEGRGLKNAFEALGKFEDGFFVGAADRLRGLVA